MSDVEFDYCNFSRTNEVYDEETTELLSYNWYIEYRITSETYGTATGTYVAEQNQLPVNATQTDAEDLILSLYNWQRKTK